MCFYGIKRKANEEHIVVHDNRHCHYWQCVWCGIGATNHRNIIKINRCGNGGDWFNGTCRFIANNKSDFFICTNRHINQNRINFTIDINGDWDAHVVTEWNDDQHAEHGTDKGYHRRTTGIE